MSDQSECNKGLYQLPQLEQFIQCMTEAFILTVKKISVICLWDRGKKCQLNHAGSFFFRNFYLLLKSGLVVQNMTRQTQRCTNSFLVL